jgi:membrane protein implicated in regulation of membrane protease activity
METLFLACAIVGGTLVVCQFLLTLVGFGGHGGDFHSGDVHFGDVHVGDMDAAHVGDVHGGGLHGDQPHAGGVEHETQPASSAGRGIGGHPAVVVRGPTGSPHGAADWFFGVLSFRTIVAAIALFGVSGEAALSGGLNTTTTLVIAVGSGIAAMYAVHGLMRGLKSLDVDRTVRIERAIGLPGTVYLSIPGHHAGSGKIHLTLQKRLDELEAVTAGERLANGTKVRVIGVVGPATVEVEPLA